MNERSTPAETGTAVASPASLAALELGDALRLLAGLTRSDVGRRRALALLPTGEPALLDARRQRHAELERLETPAPLLPGQERALEPLLLALARGRAGGRELLELASFLAAVRGAVGRIVEQGGEVPFLLEAAAAIPGDGAELDRLAASIARSFEPSGELRDDATPELQRLREQQRRVRAQVYRRLELFVTERRELLQDDTVTLRDGRLLVLLPAGHLGRLGGLLHGRSATGRSFYFEPLELVDDNNELRRVADDEEAEQRRIVAELLDRVRASEPAIAAHVELFAELDLLSASAAFGKRCDGRLAAVSCEGGLVLRAARHPLIDPLLHALREQELAAGGNQREVVPLSLELGEPRVLVVTGPNAGGKTVAAKTVGLLCLLHQCGLPIPAGAGTRLPVFSRLVAAVGDEQDLLHAQSTFSGRLLRLDEAWRSASAGTLVLVDELGSGTDPEEGAALAIALLSGLIERGAMAVLVTHLAAVAQAALESVHAGCAAMAFDQQSHLPTYRLVVGPPGASEALALARRMGLDPDFVQRAEQRLRPEHRELRRLLRALEDERARVSAHGDEVERLRAALEAEAASLSARERVLLEEQGSFKRRLRADLATFERGVRAALQAEIDGVREQAAAGRARALLEQASERLFAARPPSLAEPAPAPGHSEELLAGELVVHRTLGWRGRLAERQGEQAVVLVAGKRLRCAAAELVRAPAGSERKRPVPAVSADEEPVVPELVLIGRRVEEALVELDQYLDRALLGDRGRVRVVHGHGTGRLKQAVREFLRKHPGVRAVAPAERNQGGDGATVVSLRGFDG